MFEIQSQVSASIAAAAGARPPRRSPGSTAGIRRPTFVDADGKLEQLAGPTHPPLGTGKSEPSFKLTHRQLQPGERLILVTDGIIERRVEGGGRFRVEGLKQALERADNPTAASTAMAIQQAVTDCWKEALEDDATVVVMAIL
jgi:serine phosphatase RsbU (regulator of sigma subunit)